MSPASERRHARVVPGGPILVEGPLDVETADGAVVHCDRFLVALCACGSSSIAPLCDGSHRRKLRRRRSGQPGVVSPPSGASTSPE